jgi:O-methyltransferase involved in polyketide biosynthesis
MRHSGASPALPRPGARSPLPSSTGVVDGYARSELDGKLVSAARQGGSPWIYGLDPDELPQYLDRRGLTLIEEVWAPDFRERYLAPAGRNMDIFEGERVVLARLGS